jgi:hypothetical protein
MDLLTGRLRMFSRSGTVSTIAGNDTNSIQSTSVIATATGLQLNNNLSGNMANLFLDSSNNVYFYDSANSGIGMLPNTYATSPSTTYWTKMQTGGNNWFSGSTQYYSANGLAAKSIKASGPATFNIMGFNGTSFLINSYTTVSMVNTDNVWYEINQSTGTVTFDVGSVGTGATCADGTLISSCTAFAAAYGSPTTTAAYDSTNQYWVVWDQINSTFRTFGTGETGTIQTLPGTFSNPAGFTIQRFPTLNNNLYLYECTTSGTLYVNNVTTGTRTSITIPVPGMTCNGSEIVFDATTNSLVFTFQQNNLTGVAEILNANPGGGVVSNSL